MARRVRACAVVALVVASGCYREVSDDDLMIRPVSHGPWAVEGIVLGSPAEICEARFGEPDRRLPAPNGGTQWVWTRFHQVSVTLDRKGRVVEASGQNLTDREGGVVVWSSASEGDVRAILPSAGVEKTFRPRGSGVISLGREHVGTSYTVADDLGSYTVSVHRDQVAGVVGRWAPSGGTSAPGACTEARTLRAG